MAATIEAIVNRALIRLGDKNLIAAITDDSEPAISANVLVGPCRDSLLRAFPFNFAQRRRQLSEASVDRLVTAKTMALTLTYTSGQSVTATAASGTPFSAGDVELNIVEVNSGNGSAIITGFTDTTHVTCDVIDTFSSTSILANNWKVRLHAPAYGFDYRYVLPNGCLKVNKVNDSDEGWLVEGGYLLTNEEDLNLRYTTQITDPTKFDPAFESIYVGLLAFELSMRITTDKGVWDRMEAAFTKSMLAYAASHAQEGRYEPEVFWWHEAGGSASVSEALPAVRR